MLLHEVIWGYDGKVNSLLMNMCLHFSVWFSAPCWVQRHLKASANFKKKRENRQINTVQHHICNTRFRNHKKIMLFLNRTLDICTFTEQCSISGFPSQQHHRVYFDISFVYIFIYTLNKVPSLKIGGSKMYVPVYTHTSKQISWKHLEQKKKKKK